MNPMSEEDVRAVLREYPDADFSRHILANGVDPEALAREEAAKTFAAIEKRARTLCSGMSIAHDAALVHEGPQLLGGLLDELGRVRNQLELAREDLECVHLWLDDEGAPREGEEGALSVVGRMKVLLRTSLKREKE